MGALSRKLRSIEGGGVTFMCPGCGYAHVVWIKPDPARPARPCWGYNGNPEKPTFTPSILLTGHEWHPPVTPENLEEWRRSPWPQHQVERRCHSFITDGRIQFLGDCTHELRGQTVDLPDWTEEGT